MYDSILIPDSGPGIPRSYLVAILMVSGVTAVIGGVAAKPILAEGDAGSAFLGMLLVAVGSAATWVVTQWGKWSDKRRDGKEKDRKNKNEDMASQIVTYRELLARVDQDRKEAIAEREKVRDELESEIIALRADVAHLMIRSERAVTWIESLQDVLDTHKISHRKWSEPPTPSGRYSPAPPVVPPGDFL